MYTTIHAAPDAKNVRAWMFDGSRERIRALLLMSADEGTRVEIPMDRAVLEALQAALDEIRADMDAAAAAIPASGDIAQVGPSNVPGYWTGTAKRAAVQAAVAELEYVTGASDQVPTVMADWPAGPPGEALGVFGK